MLEEIPEKILKQAQNYYSRSPTIILGSGASAAFKMPSMGELADHLKNNISNSDLNESEKSVWGEFCNELDAGTDLETALHNIHLSESLTTKVVLSTWKLLTPKDLSIFHESLSSPNFFPLGKILKHMFGSTISEINIITTNYDRLAEYACEQENIHYYNGFSHGYKKLPVAKDYLKCSRKVNIWKVHGSLDWFMDENNLIISLSHEENIPEKLKPLIVTPGIEKYRSTHKEPYKSNIHESDNIIDASSAYLCIGFGFNDEHIQEKLITRCARNDTPVIIITFKLSDSAKKLIRNGSVSNYLAIESGNSEESVIHSSMESDPITVKGDFWSLLGFSTLVM